MIVTKVQDGWILPKPLRVPSPNTSTNLERKPGRVPPRGDLVTDLLVLHYAVDPSQRTDDAEDVARGFQRRNSSAHFVIGRDGSLRQCVELSATAVHAGDGKSRLPPSGLGHLSNTPYVPWQTNRRSIGIELCNVGWDVKKFKVPPSHQLTAQHPAGWRDQQWERFTDAQIEKLLELVALLRMTVPTLRLVCGHEDVCNRDTMGKRYGGKLDPGPAFPWGAIDWIGHGYQRVAYDFSRQEWIAVDADRKPVPTSPATPPPKTDRKDAPPKDGEKRERFG